MKVFLLENNTQLRGSIEKHLKEQQHDVTCLKSNEDLFANIDKFYYDIFIIDLNLPNNNALEVIQYIRQSDLDTSIIVLCEANDMSLLEKAYSLGINEYIKKPFLIHELMIKINLLSNKNNNHVNASIINFNDDLIYDNENKNFIYKGETIPLRKKEKRFIEILVNSLNKIVPTDKITYFVWENEIKEHYPMRQLVSSLRKKLPLDFIKTEIGIGYKIELKN